MPSRANQIRLALAGLALALPAPSAQAGQPAPAAAEATYADVADMADSAGFVMRARVTRVSRVEDARAPNVKAGSGRFYIEARVAALLAGSAAIGESVKYLVDMPLDPEGRPAKLKKREVLLFARGVPGRPDELQLVGPGAQQLWSVEAEARVRAVLSALVAADAPARVTGVRELLYVPGNLAGQGETQIFLATRGGSAASITVRHEPGKAPAWGVSFSELVADVTRPPQADTLEWYRLACFLPNVPPRGTNVSPGLVAKRQAEADYRMVLGELGVCRRNLS